ncbi:MAG TPA: 7-cyano-7-deazaguanine synthase QueC [Sphingobium sp.]|nr:7-cyano-7-deazaguanine synthase QueC [Sphingobium sp.]
MASEQPIAVVLISGGLDSMVVAGLAREAGFRIAALTIDYNQRHQIELEAANRVVAAVGAERHVVLPLDLSLFGGSALTADIAVPKDGVGDDIPITYVPARNTIFLSLTLGFAEVVGARHIFIGVNALDYSGYPDCRAEYIAAFEAMAALATRDGVEGRAVRIEAPLQHMTKAQIALEADRLGLDAGMSWSCYDPTPEGLHCGLCDSCRLRARGYIEAGLPDPTRYAVQP